MPALLKAAAALSLLMPCLSAKAPDVYGVADDPRIVLVDCWTSRGSAFQVGPHHYLSVNHVTGNEGCKVNGQPIDVRGVSEDQDFSVFTAAGVGEALRIDCGGFIEGRKYIAIGHARGLEQLTAVELVATGKYESSRGFAVLKGVATVIPGQSGGPIFDKETMRPVGTVNVYDASRGISGSTELKQTEVCRHV